MVLTSFVIRTRRTNRIKREREKEKDPGPTQSSCPEATGDPVNRKNPPVRTGGFRVGISPVTDYLRRPAMASAKEPRPNRAIVVGSGISTTLSMYWTGVP